MQVIEAGAVGFSSGTIDEISFRHSAFWSQSWPSDQFVRIAMGTTSLAPDQLPSEFSQIPDSPMTVVFEDLFSIPASSIHEFPEPWNVVFPLDVPFTYEALSGNLVLELEVVPVVSPSPGWSADAHVREPSGSGVQILNPGCAGFDSQVLIGGQDAVPGGAVRFYLEYSPLILDGLSMIGVPSAGFPFDLGPLGSPGCFLQSSPLLTQPFQLSPTLWTATAFAEWSIPANPALAGKSFDHQAVLLGSPFTGPIDPVTSHAHRVFLGAPTGTLPSVTQTLRGAPGAEVGTLPEPSTGYIVRFGIQ